ncbi:expressed unknown protein [Seminavis robusta]|uniref:Uncharacterized protein n=1 Tax=Seminavis robusta TaxID=568900 RepID=A0A9N8H2E1_9STRA|nr:expressed unknown protein [Seminavis robusta]|eukprot:Sro63_g035750.1 n/a (1389) ;mRNA; f:48424-52590
MRQANSNDVLFYSVRQQYDDLSPKELAVLEARRATVLSLSSDEPGSDTQTETESDSSATHSTAADGTGNSPANSSDKSLKQSNSWKSGLRVLERRQKDRGVSDASLDLSNESPPQTSAPTFEEDVSKVSELGDAINKVLQNISDPDQILGIPVSSSENTDTDQEDDQEDEEEEQREREKEADMEEVANLEVSKQFARLSSKKGKSFDMIVFNDVNKARSSQREASMTGGTKGSQDGGESIKGDNRRNGGYTTAEDLKKKFQDVLAVENETEKLERHKKAKQEVGDQKEAREEAKEEEKERERVHELTSEVTVDPPGTRTIESVLDSNTEQLEVVFTPSSEGSVGISRRNKWSKRKSKVVRTITRYKSSFKARMVKNSHLRLFKVKGTTWIKKRLGRKEAKETSSQPLHQRMRASLNVKMPKLSKKRLKQGYRKVANELQVTARRSVRRIPQLNVSTIARRSIAPFSASVVRTARQCKMGASGVISSLRRSGIAEKDEDVEDVYAIMPDIVPPDIPDMQGSTRTGADSKLPKESQTDDLVYSVGETASQDTMADQTHSSGHRESLIIADNGEIETSVPKEKMTESDVTENAAAGIDKVLGEDEKASPSGNLQTNDNDGVTPTIIVRQHNSGGEDIPSPGINDNHNGGFYTLHDDPDPTAETNDNEDAEDLSMAAQSEEKTEATPISSASVERPLGDKDYEELDLDESVELVDFGGKQKRAGQDINRRPHGMDSKESDRREPAPKELTRTSTPKIVERFDQDKPKQSTSSSEEGNPEGFIEIVKGDTPVEATAGNSGATQGLVVPPASKKLSKWRKSLLAKTGSSRANRHVIEAPPLSRDFDEPAANGKPSASDTQRPRRGSKQLMKLISSDIPDPPNPISAKNLVQSRSRRTPPIPYSRNVHESHAARIKTSFSDSGILPTKRNKAMSHEGNKIREDSTRLLPEVMPPSPATGSHNTNKGDKRLSSSIVATDDAGVEMIANGQDGGDDANEREHDERNNATKKKRSSIKARTIGFLKPKKRVSYLQDESGNTEKLLRDDVSPVSDEEPIEEPTETTPPMEEHSAASAGQHSDDLESLTAVEIKSMQSSDIEETLPDMDDDTQMPMGYLFDFSRFICSDFPGLFSAPNEDPELMPNCSDADTHTGSVESRATSTANTTRSSSFVSPAKTRRPGKYPIVLLDEKNDDTTCEEFSRENDDAESVLSSPALFNQFFAFQECHGVCALNQPNDARFDSDSDGSSDESSVDLGKIEHEDYSSTFFDSGSNRTPARRSVESEDNIPSKWIQFRDRLDPVDETIPAPPPPEAPEEKKKPKRGVKKRLLSLVKRQKKAEKVNARNQDDENPISGSGRHVPSFVSMLSDDPSTGTGTRSNNSDVFSGVTSNASPLSSQK